MHRRSEDVQTLAGQKVMAMCSKPPVCFTAHQQLRTTEHPGSPPVIPPSIGHTSSLEEPSATISVHRADDSQEHQSDTGPSEGLEHDAS